MKILVNAIPLLNISTGIGRYLKELYTEIARVHPEFEIKFFDGTRLLEQMPTPPSENSSWSLLVKVAWAVPPKLTYFARTILHQRRAKRFLQLSKGFDIYHEAGFFPFPAAPGVKTLFTIHDLSWRVYPEHHPRERILFFKKYFDFSLELADGIVTPSRFTKTEINRLYPYLRAEIKPTLLGVDQQIFHPRPDTEVNALRLKLGLPEKYLLFVGTSDPRKNISGIIQAIAPLPDEIKLVCTGWSGWEKAVNQEIEKRVCYTGYLSDQELATLYSGARAFVYPSFYEGFGLPVLEAMACGCPVITSTLSSLPEVAGNAGILCDPHDIQQLADAIQSIYESDERYQQMSKASRQRAGHFSWEKCAWETSRAFTHLSSGSSH